MAAERAGHPRHRRASAARAASCGTSKGKRFMFGDIPDNYKPQTAKDEEEGWRYVLGDKDASRPPELLTRDHVARCIVREVKEGRGSPHGGVFLELHSPSGSRRSSKFNAEEHMEEEAAEHVPPVQGTRRARHHEGADGGRPDHALHHGRRAGRRRHADVHACRGCSRAGECAAGINGANRLGGNSLSDLLVLGKRRANSRRKYAKEQQCAQQVHAAQVEAIGREVGSRPVRPQ